MMVWKKGNSLETWQFLVHSGKLTYQCKMDPLKMYFLLKLGTFHCHVSLPEGIYVRFLGCNPLHLEGFCISISHLKNPGFGTRTGRMFSDYQTVPKTHNKRMPIPIGAIGTIVY